MKSPLARVTAPTTSACVGETSNEAEKTSDVADDTPISAACGPNSTSNPAPSVQMTTTGKMAMLPMPHNAPRKAATATSAPAPATMRARKRCPGWNTAMSVKNAPTAPHPPTRGYPAAMPMARGTPMDTAQMNPMNGDDIDRSMRRVQAHRVRNEVPTPSPRSGATVYGLALGLLPRAVPSSSHRHVRTWVGGERGARPAHSVAQVRCFSPQKQANGFSLYAGTSA